MAITEYGKRREQFFKDKGKSYDGLTILEALAATGLRSVRYLKEIPGINTLMANDIDPAATELMTKNFEFNDIDEK